MRRFDYDPDTALGEVADQLAQHLRHQREGDTAQAVIAARAAEYAMQVLTDEAIVMAIQDVGSARQVSERTAIPRTTVDYRARRCATRREGGEQACDA